MEILAEQIHDVQAGLAMFTQETQQIFAFHHRHLRIIEQFGADFVRSAREGRAQAEDFAGHSKRAIGYLEQHGMQRVPTEGPRTWHYATSVGGVTTDLIKMDIDHVMIDDALAARDGQVLDAGTSDHRPVVVTIEKK